MMLTPVSPRLHTVAASDDGVRFSFEELRRICQPRLMTTPPGMNPLGEIRGVSTDTRTIRPGELFVALVGERFDGHHYVREAFNRGAAAAIVSRGSCVQNAPGPVLVVDDTLRAWGDLAHWHRRYMRTTVIGITGTNGKTTTKDLLAHLLGNEDEVHRTKANHNNLIGVPQTLFGLREHHRYAVVEMGTNQPGEIARLAEIVAPDAGILTMVGPGHLEGLGTIEGVVEEKSALLAALPGDGVAVVNFDCIHSVAASAAVPPRTRTISFGLDARCEFRADDLRAANGSVRFRLGNLGPAAPVKRGITGFWRMRDRQYESTDAHVLELPMTGVHNVSNALAAIAIAWWAGVTFEEIRERLRTFEPPALRLTRRELVGGRVLVLDDCYNANPASMASALQTLADEPAARRRVAVLGTMGELGDLSDACHRQLGQSLARHGVQTVITVGDGARVVGTEARRTGVQAHHAGDACDAGELLAQLVNDGDVVLVKGSRSVGLEVVSRTLIAEEDTIESRWAAPTRSRTLRRA